MDLDEDIDGINERLSKLDIYRDIHSARKLMKKIIRASSTGLDTSKLFPGVAKLIASNDLLVKKLAYWYIINNADNNDLILLILNTLLKDCEDSNPMTRGLAIRTLTNIPVAEILDYCTQPITMGLRDSNAYVRRAAVMATIRVHQSQSELVLESGWIDMLYKMIRDSDPIVVSNSLHALSVILVKEGGIVVNRNMANHLLNRIESFQDYHIINVMRTLKKYRPKTEDETLDIMNILDIHLKSSNASIAIETLNYFLFLIKKMPQLKSELYRRANEQIQQLLGSSNAELVFSLLEYIECLIKDGSDFTAQYKIFFSKYNDPTYLKIKKIEILPYLTNDANVSDILDELNMYCLDVSICKTSVHAMSIIAHSYPSYSNITISSLLHLLQLHPEDVGEDVFKVLQTLDLAQLDNQKEAFETIKNASIVVESDSGKIAFACLLGKYGEYIDTAPYLLEDYILETINNNLTDLCMSLLTAGTKLFLKRPAECQHMLARLLEHCMNQTDINLRDKALFYYHMLKSSPSDAANVMFSKIYSRTDE